MKVLVMSDSHSGLSFMRTAIQAVKPDAVVHLGDHYEDAETIADENPHIRFHQVPGNCDRYRMYKPCPETLCYPIGGVMIYMTHGHNHRVKMSLYSLLADARAVGARIVLYGHTHIPQLYQEEDGLWVMNPGACGSAGGSVGLLQLEQGSIISCQLLAWDDLIQIKQGS